MPGSRSARFEHIQPNGSRLERVEWARVGRLVYDSLEAAFARIITIVAVILVLAALLVSLLFRPKSAQAAPLDPQSEDWEGLSELVRMAEAEIGTERVFVRDVLDVGDLRSNDSLIIIHPQGQVAADEL